MDSKIILCKEINIDREYVNVLNYTETQMLELCQQNQTAIKNNYSFIRKTGEIYTDIPFATCLQSNYMAFQNPSYSNKWFFAWITDVKYISNNNTQIFYQVDSWSTWFDYWKPKTCFVTRQHVKDDIIGKYTQNENLNVGEVIEEEIDKYTNLAENFYYIIFSAYNPASKIEFAGVNNINGILFGTNVFAFENTTTGVVSLRHFIEATNKDGKINDIQSLNIAPKTLMDNIGLREQEGIFDGATYNFYIVEPSSDTANNPITIPYIIDKTLTYSDFTPKNKKCFVYPYNYLLLSNNIGNQNIYKYEDFYVNSGQEDFIQFEIELALSIGISGRAVPRGYKKMDYNIDESIPLAKYPTCSWSADAFTNWLTANSVNITTDIINTGLGVATGNVVSVAGNIAGLIGQFYQADLLPNITGGDNTGDINFSTRNNTFTFHHMRVKTEYLEIIDNYFTRFGYKINKLVMPNITGRKYWNYVEIGQDEDIGFGSVPASDMDIINRACRRGVTIWHNHNNVGDYSLNNEII